MYKLIIENNDYFMELFNSKHYFCWLLSNDQKAIERCFEIWPEYGGDASDVQTAEKFQIGIKDLDLLNKRLNQIQCCFTGKIHMESEYRLDPNLDPYDPKAILGYYDPENIDFDCKVIKE